MKVHTHALLSGALVSQGDVLVVDMTGLVGIIPG